MNKKNFNLNLYDRENIEKAKQIFSEEELQELASKQVLERSKKGNTHLRRAQLQAINNIYVIKQPKNNYVTPKLRVLTDGVDISAKCFTKNELLPTPVESLIYFKKKYDVETETDNGLILNYLIQYYSDIFEIIRRIGNGIRDLAVTPVFAKILKDRSSNKDAALTEFIHFYNDVFTEAVLDFFSKKIHNTFDESYGEHYKTFFDKQFVLLLYKHYVLIVKNRFHSVTFSSKLHKNADIFDVPLKWVEIISLSDLSEEETINLGLTDELPEYPRDYLEELAFHNSFL